MKRKWSLSDEIKDLSNSSLKDASILQNDPCAVVVSYASKPRGRNVKAQPENNVEMEIENDSSKVLVHYLA